MWQEINSLVHNHDLRYADFYVQDTVNIAVATLLVHTAFADKSFHQDEVDMIRGMLKDRFGYNDAIIDDLIISAGVTGDAYVDIHELIDTIKNNFNDQEIREFFKTIWHIIMADGKIHPLEQRIANILAARFNIGPMEHEEIKREVLMNSGPGFKTAVQKILDDS